MKTIAWIRVLVALIFTTSSPIFAQWVQTNGPYGGSIGCFAVSDMNLFAGTSGSGVFLSTNNGTSWTEVNTGLTSSFVYALAVSGTNLFAGTYDGIFLSTNNGTSWTAVNTGLTNTNVLSLAPDLLSGNLFAGTYGGVWRRPLSEIITSVERLSTDLPTHFILDQNYPNPFNPTTRISFSLPSKAFVSLKVFDALGREQAVLVSEELAAGRYARQWDATGLASGVYFYRLQADAFAETKKLVLLR